MDPQIWVAVAAVFLSGGAIGSAGTLLTQWILRKVDTPPGPVRALDAVERDALRAEVAELHKQIRNMDARLDFTERLLDGALSVAPPPKRLRTSDPDAEGEPVDHDRV